jgi:very-short-patch-repair endonuclease
MMPYRESLKEFARELRKNMTSQEKKLWYDFLRVNKIRFQRQKPILYYIVDFYAASIKLGIELDGGQHYTDGGMARDGVRTKSLASLGIQIIRFTNRDIDDNFNEVCLYIDKKIHEKITCRL